MLKQPKLGVYIMEEKIINAMEKLKNEPCKDAMDRLKKMVLSELEKEDIQLAEGVLAPLKSMQSCWKHIVEWARKKAINNCAMIEDAEVLSEAIHYFVDVEEKAPEKIRPVSSTPKCTPENRPKITSVTSKTTKDKAEEAIISLF